MGTSFGGTVKLTGESEYKKALKEIKNNLNLLGSELKMTASLYDVNDRSISNLTSQNEILTKKMEEQKSKVAVLTKALSDAKGETGENSETTKKWQYELNNAQTELNLLNKELKDNSEELKNVKKENEQLNNANKVTITGLKSFTAELLKDAAGVENLGKTIKSDLNIRMTELKEKITPTISNIKSFGSSILGVIQHPSKLGEAIKSGLIHTADKLDNSTKKNTESLKSMKSGFDEAGSGALKFGDLVKANVLGEMITSGLKAVGTAIKEIGKSFVDIGKQAVTSFGDFEQLEGGVKKLFGDDMAQAVIDNANNAFQTAGMNANEYMDTVTGFSASLISSLDGNTKKAVGYADTAIRDMSDNANTFGTDISSIQNAYQGFAKQNYTMLDNLKLGYRAELRQKCNVC